MLNIAHRGARSLAPENTFSAAQKALEVGADLWEMDVAMTADREIVLLHDNTLLRTSNAAIVFPERAPWRVCDFSLEELLQIDFGSWFNEKDPFRQIALGNVSRAEQTKFIGEHIPTLRQALEFTREHNWKAIVEIKDLSQTCKDHEIAFRVANMVQEMEMTGQVTVSSFNHKYLSSVKKAVPVVQTAALAHFPHLAPVRLLRRLNAQAYHRGVKYLFTGSIRRLNLAGYKVNVYTVNDEKTMRRLIKAGVNGIFTDFPQLLNRVLKG